MIHRACPSSRKTAHNPCSLESPAMLSAFSMSAPRMAMFFAPICGCAPTRAPTCTALRRLAASRRIDEHTAETLIADYRFLRRIEHRLQMADDAQTHRLPTDQAGIARLASFLGERDSDRFVTELRAHLGS